MRKSINTGLILLLFTVEIFAGFNTVVNNELNMDEEYSFGDFFGDFGVGRNFVCSVRDDYWDVPFKTVVKIKTKSLISGISFSDMSQEYEFTVSENDFNRFRESFISGSCLKFENNFPVKYFKVKTKTRVSEIEFTEAPDSSAEKIANTTAVNNITYYAYAVKERDNNKYVLLGSTKEIDLTVHVDLDLLVGWLQVERDGSEESAVLWNTNIGIRPLDSGSFDRKPYVFLVDSFTVAVDYRSTGVPPNPKSLLVDKGAINNYLERYEEKNRQINRWLPIYTSSKHGMRVGIIEDMGVLRRDLINFGTSKYFQIALIVDATASMTPVWNNMPTILNKILEEIADKKYKNLEGKEVSPMIKLYYYNYRQRSLLNKDKWFKTKQDVRDYKNVIDAIIPVPSNEFRPPMSETIRMVLDEIGNKHTFMVVIGDAGDETYRGLDLGTTELFRQDLENAKNIFYSVNGVRINSNPDALGYDPVYHHADYTDAYNEFKNNFPLIYDVTFNSSTYGSGNLLSEAEAENIGEKIANSIINEFKSVLEQITSAFVSGKPTDGGSINKSTFSDPFLESIKQLRNSTGQGTFFEPGYVTLKDNSGNPLYGKDILIEGEKIKRLKKAFKEYSFHTSKSNAEKLIKKTLAAFFEIDYVEVSDEFLNETTYETFWTTIVGDKEVAEALIPGLFRTNISFKQIIENRSDFEEQLLINAREIDTSLADYLNNETGKYAIVRNIAGNITYYWIDVDDIMLFKGIKLRGSE